MKQFRSVNTKTGISPDRPMNRHEAMGILMRRRDEVIHERFCLTGGSEDEYEAVVNEVYEELQLEEVA